MQDIKDFVVGAKVVLYDDKDFVGKIVSLIDDKKVRVKWSDRNIDDNLIANLIILTPEYLKQQDQTIDDINGKLAKATHLLEEAFKAFKEAKAMCEEDGISHYNDKIDFDAFGKVAEDNISGWSSSSLFC